MPIDMVTRAINNLDLKQLTLENVEMLQKMTPTEQEIKAYKEYVADKKDVNQLTDEDKFVLQLTKIERISAKLSIMNYMGNFVECLHLISPVRKLVAINFDNQSMIHYNYTLINCYYFTANCRNN